MNVNVEFFFFLLQLKTKSFKETSL